MNASEQADSDNFRARGDAPEERTRVLIADDGTRVRSAMRALLTTIPGVEVVGEACDGREALRLAESLRPDVIMLDVRMPHTNGLQAARRVKRLWPAMRVIVLTMCGEHRGEAVACGADAFLVKGCSTDELAKAVIADSATGS